MFSTAVFFAAFVAFASPVKTDETVTLFPVAARFDAAQNAWVGELHGWIYEPEEDSGWRREVVRKLEQAAALDQIEWDRELLRNRAMPFLADNEGGKRIEVRLINQTIKCEPSEANGHFLGEFTLPCASVAPDVSQLTAELVLAEGDDRKFSGTVFLIPRQGLSVVSDIDDTIKVSNVLDKKELLRNTFARPFTPVAGIPDVYSKLAERGAAFHYVSASPWQLYATLATFREEQKFPAGTFDMKSFRAWDRSWENLMANSALIKTPAIERLFKVYPERKFLLIGDSGESDPEIYGAIARKFPEQTLAIAIRSVRAEESLGDERYKKALAEVPAEKLILFKEAKEISEFLEAISFSQ